MKVAVSLPTVRPDLLRSHLQSHVLNPQAIDEIHIIAQRNDLASWQQVVDPFREKISAKLILSWQPESGPVYRKRWSYASTCSDIDVWIQSDDDIEVLPETNWGLLARAVHSGQYGVVSGGWVRNESPALRAKVWPARTPNWVEQPFTNTSGGMAIPKRLIPFLAAPRNEGMGMDSWQFCDIQVGLTSYLLGEQPARFRGSLAIHRILTPKGLSGNDGIFAKIPHCPPDSKWINTKPQKPKYKNGNDWLMPIPADITLEAKQRHKENAR